MFGYVTICKNSLKEQDYELFRAYYCGLCRAIGKRCSQSARMGLSYDITFLAIMLSSVTDCSSEKNKKRCMLHPMKKNICIENDMAVDYAADVGVMLSYLKFSDDLHDEKSFKSLLCMMFLKRGVKKAKKHYPFIYDKIKDCLDKLSILEKNNCREIDKTADCFAKILEVLFTPDFISDNKTKRILAWLGYNIGRWIYIIDAYNDIEKDIEKHNYNTFVCGGESSADNIRTQIRETLDLSLTLTLENAASAYDLLTVRKNKEILDNIIYTSLKMKQNYILGEKNESL